MRRSSIPLIFMLSGAAGLIFEVVWSRQLVLVFGNTTQAVSVILTGFFGGMALGSWLGGKVADTVRRPLLMYGILELLLVGFVLVTPLSFRLINEIYRSTYASLEGSPAELSLVRFGLALLALAPATMLMGATLPTLTRYLARQADDLNSAFSALYVANTMGAVFGASIAGIVLIEVLGLSGTMEIGAACSGIAGLLAISLERLPDSTGAAADPHSVASAVAVHPSHLRLALMVAFASGLTSLGYQVIWMRLIASGTGSSTYVFTDILTLFLIGLALGAVEYKRRRANIRNVIPILAAGQIAIAAFAVIGMFLINAMDGLDGAFVWKAIVVILPPTFVMGFSFPAAAALLGGEDVQVGSRSGYLLTANTAGAIVATFLIPFVLIPLVGSPLSIALVAIVNVATGLIIAVRTNVTIRFRRVLIGVGVFAVALITFAVSTHSVFIDPGVARIQRTGGTVYQTKEDEIASVQAGFENGEKQLWVTGFSMTALTVDAKLMPVLPLIFRPASRSALVVAFGMGSAFRASLIAGLATEAVELVPSVPRLFGHYYADAAAVRANPRGRVIAADGRNHVELTTEQYDIIVVDPPPPLESAGVSVISSLEFYAASRKRLTPNGIMMQWVPSSQSLADFKNHVRTFRKVFSNVVIAVGPGGNGFYMLGSNSALVLESAAVRDVISRPGVVQDLSSVSDSPTSSVDGWTSLIPRLIRLRDDQVAEFSGPGPLITDDRPLPEYFLLKRRTAPNGQWMNPADVRAPPLN